jgi:hypothetical protein
LKSPHPSLNYAIQFFLINAPQNLMQALKKLIPVSQLNLVDFFFDCRKQVEITGAKSRESGMWVWHAAHVMFFEPICSSLACVNRAIMETSDEAFLIRHASLRNNPLFKENEFLYQKIVIVHFGITSESVDNREDARLSCNWKNEFFALNIKSRFCDHVISQQSGRSIW